jgi:8-oxo-dGTP diphosphatase
MERKMSEWFKGEVERLEGTPEYEEAKLLLDLTEGFLERHPEEQDAVGALTRMVDRALVERDNAVERPDVIVAVAIQYKATGKVLLGRRGKDAEGSGLFGLPGGHMRRGESIGVCARREVREETGIYRLYNLHVIDVQDDVRPDAGICQPVIFMGCTAHQNPVNEEPDLCDGWGWYAPNRLPPEQEMFTTLVGFFKKLRSER